VDFEIARLDLAKLDVSAGGSLRGALANLMRISAHTLDVARVGFWTFDDDRTRLSCAVSFERDPPPSGWRSLRGVDIPSYVAAIRERRVVSADDAWTHPATRELREAYLVPLGITSMLDAPVYQDGVVMGVVCHEHVGPARTWTEAEQDFAASVADVVATLLQKERVLVAEASLREANKMEALGKLAVSVAHDFTSVLTAVRLLASQLARKDLPSEQVAQLGREIDDATTHGVRLAQQLLAFGRSSKAERRRVSLGEVVLEREAALRALARGRAAITIERSSEPDFVEAAPFQIEQVLFNLVGNALDALAKSIRIAIRDDPHGVVLEVADDGAGMTEAVRARVFEPYFTTKPAGSGTGLGLAIVYGTAKQLGGDVQVESEPMRGATFRVLLPKAAEP